jgi:hypothetical protein
MKGRERMKKKIILLIGIMVIISMLPLGTVSSKKGDTGQTGNGNITIFIFGVFPKYDEENQTVTFWSLYSNNSQFPRSTLVTIYSENRFVGHAGRFFIYGRITYLLTPHAEFEYEKGTLRIIERPLAFWSVSSDVDGKIVDTQWLFDDSTEWISGEFVTHVFSEEGYHSVTLKVIDDDGLQDITTSSVRIYARTPIYQCRKNAGNHTLTIVGYQVLGSFKQYDWTDFQNMGSGSCILPTSGHPQIGDVITNCSGEIILLYTPNDNIAGYWQF